MSHEKTIHDGKKKKNSFKKMKKHRAERKARREERKSQEAIVSKHKRKPRRIKQTKE